MNERLIIERTGQMMTDFMKSGGKYPTNEAVLSVPWEYNFQGKSGACEDSFLIRVKDDNMAALINIGDTIKIKGTLRGQHWSRDGEIKNKMWVDVRDINVLRATEKGEVVGVEGFVPDEDKIINIDSIL